jgi:hypothetical protein
MRPHGLATDGGQVDVQLRRVENRPAGNRTQIKSEQAAFLASADKAGVERLIITICIRTGRPDIGIGHVTQRPAPNGDTIAVWGSRR